ncbi:MULTISPECIES: glycine zipper domain-containing protein [unclassified Caballeronia]|uniref:DUF883 family protein n=1 Tax=unclassified Caballeronia TaxID=2646786 RepID=UPI00286699AB|nr:MULTISPECIES: DUF883 domain-containing protein [unclassified Caballeronia]MDR5763164.1 DUF883 domain-containing protein [Caballeronia sp. LZ035]MDR5883966.1 DUF883 domain-containing protein [Caballeronia sp. LZ032]
MADNDRTLDPVDALKTERAGSSYEFPTSESMATDGHSEPSAKRDGHGFREASQSWNGGSNGASGDLRSSAKDKFADMQDAMSRKYRVAADTTDDFVHENPWNAIAIAALAGVVVGMLASR